MIPALLIWLYKKYLSGNSQTSLKIPRMFRIITGKALLLLLIPSTLSATEEKLAVYNIKHKGLVIGQLNLSQRTTGEHLYLQLDSRVKTRFVFGIDVKTTDQAHFSKGTLVSSNVYRMVNGKEKDSKKTSLMNNFYQTLSGRDTGRLEQTITYNMMMLYLREPVDIRQVYSDNFLKFIPIRRTAAHSYRVDLPDGNFNEYHFQNGICRQVVIHHSMYTIHMELSRTS